jgi:predicted transcriptional regulator
MSRRRSRLEIILSILSAVRDGMDKPTRIMYAANLSWKPIQKILSDLVEQGLLEMRIAPGLSRKRYVITEKGVNTLEYFKKAKEMLPEDAYLAHAVSS